MRSFNSHDLLVEHNFDLNENCQNNMGDILFMVDILLDNEANNLFIDYNKDFIVDIFDLYHFIEKLNLNWFYKFLKF